MTNSSMLASVRLVLLATALAILGGACSNGSEGRSTGVSTDTTGAKPGTAEIVSLEVPTSVVCGGGTSTSVTVSYATDGAAKLTLLVDGRPYDQTGSPTATLDVPVHCDPLPHTFVLVADDAEGGRVSDERRLTTEP